MTSGQPSHDASRPANFDRVARLYRWAEYLLLGRLLERTREHLLPEVAGAKRALVLGDGDGRFLAALLRRSPSMEATAVDTSAAMLQLLQQRCAFAGPRLQTVQASVTALPASLDLAGTDLVVTHFLLDCLSQGELDPLAGQLARSTAPGARWLVSDFAVPARQPWRLLGAFYIQLLYKAFRILTGLRTQRLPDTASALRSAGFRRIHHVQWLRGLLYTELWQR